MKKYNRLYSRNTTAFGTPISLQTQDILHHLHRTKVSRSKRMKVHYWTSLYKIKGLFNRSIMANQQIDMRKVNHGASPKGIHNGTLKFQGPSEQQGRAFEHLNFDNRVKQILFVRAFQFEKTYCNWKLGLNK